MPSFLAVADRDMKVSHAFVSSSVRVPKLIFRLRTRVRAPNSAVMQCNFRMIQDHEQGGFFVFGFGNALVEDVISGDGGEEVVELIFQPEMLIH